MDLWSVMLQVILRSISRCQKDETSNESDLVAMDTQEEQYSPSDFINQQRTSSGLFKYVIPKS